MREVPILFNTEMVRAILAGEKTQTRRIVKPQPTNTCWSTVGWLGFEEGHSYHMKPPCEAGDVLWVRETFDNVALGHPWYYKADGDLRPECWKGEKWRPSIHMPREAARIFLKVKDVRIKRLQEISDEAAIAEGSNCKDGKNVGVEEKMRRGPIDRFAEIWDSTLKPVDIERFGWAANPWVWVIEFERCEKPEGWS